jgi:THO complex subunit 2
MILAHESIRLAEFGTSLPKTYDDWEGESELISLPDSAPHRPVDKIVLGAGTEKVKVAIVCPPTIWGKGRGPDNQKSMQVEHSVQLFLKQGKAFKLGRSENVWHQVHVRDLTELYLLLVSGMLVKGGWTPWLM